MVMDTLQIRLGKGLIQIIDSLVEKGIYSSRSDAIRDAVRRTFWEKEVGSITKKGNSVKLVSDARKKLSERKH